jgi:hypothetical protein
VAVRVADAVLERDDAALGRRRLEPELQFGQVVGVHEAPAVGSDQLVRVVAG